MMGSNRLRAAHYAFYDFGKDNPGSNNMLFDYNMPRLMDTPAIQEAQKACKETAIAQIILRQEQGLIEEIDPTIIGTVLWTYTHGILHLRRENNLSSFLGDKDTNQDLLTETVLQPAIKELVFEPQPPALSL